MTLPSHEREAVELLPCPHCGPGASMCDPVYSFLPNRWQVFCGACGASSGSCPTEGEAVALWNRRPHPPASIAAWNRRSDRGYAQGVRDCIAKIDDDRYTMSGPAFADILRTLLPKEPADAD